MPRPFPSWRSLCLGLSCAALPAVVAAAIVPDHPPPRLPAPWAGTAIRIDGLLDERAWDEALWLTGFVQQVPLPGSPVSQRTEVGILYDTGSLYLGVVCGDLDPDRILARTLARDDFSFMADDLFAVAIDPGRTGRDGVWFATNPLGAQFDAQIVNEGRIFDTAWDAVWEVRSRVGAAGWTAEMRIPLSSLRFGDASPVILGFNFHRLIRRHNEETYLPAIPREYGDETALSLALPVVLEGVRGCAALQILPHGVAERREPAAPDAGTTVRGQAGLDIKWGVTPSLTADLTINADFAETEIDQQQINFTRFPLFFPEKREFFLENAGLFDFGLPGELQVFHSRRIGLEDGRTVPLRLGGRLSGRTGRATVGALVALTDDVPEAPRTRFGVLRLRRDLGTRASAGLIVTDRRSDAGDNRVAGADLLVPIGQEHRIHGFIAASDTKGNAGDGGAGWIRFAREGDIWRYSAEYLRVDPEFVTGTGFVQRPDQRRRRGSFAWRPRPRASAIRQWSLLYSPTYLTDAGDRLMTRLHFFEVAAEFHTGDTLGLSHVDDFERLPAPFAIFPGVTIPPGDYNNTEIQATATTSGNRRLAASVFANHGDFFGGRRRIAGGSLTARTGRHLTIAAEFTRNRVRLPGGDLDTCLSALRLRMALSTTLFGGLLIQSNSLTDEVALNLRLNWIHRPGSDFFLVYNRPLRQPAAPSTPGDDRETLLLKLTYLWQF